jgi:hypothetical protein
MSSIASRVRLTGCVTMLVIGVSIITTASVSAQPSANYFVFCHRPTNNPNLWPFANNTCVRTGQSTGNNTGAWALAYPTTRGNLQTCRTSSSGEYTNLFCNVLAGVGQGAFGLEARNEPAPALVGVALDAATLKGEPGGIKTAVECMTGKFTGQPEGTGKLSEGELEGTNCTVSSPSGCTVKTPIIEEFTGQLLSGDKVLFVGAKELSSTTKEVFTEITYGGSACSLGGRSFPLKGQQYCEGESILTLKELQKLFCRASESSLKFGQSAGTYQNELGIVTETSKEVTSKEYWATLLLTP